MKKIKFTWFIILIIAFLLFIYSWLNSYPISFSSPFDFEFNQISVYYWISMIILFPLLLIYGVNTEDAFKQFICTITTVVLIYSKTIFNYRIYGSDANQFIGYLDYFTKTNDLTPTSLRAYFQWPIFFHLNKIVINVSGIDLKYFESILFFLIGILLSGFIFIYIKEKNYNGYIGTVTFFIILFRIFNYQWSPYTLSIGFLMMLIFLEKRSKDRIATTFIIILFFILTYTHVLTPIFFIIYLFYLYFFTKDRKYSNLFMLSIIVFTIIQTSNVLFSDYVRQLTDLYFGEFQEGIQRVAITSIAPQPVIDVFAQTISRGLTILTLIIAMIGLGLLWYHKKLDNKDYSMILVGAMFIPTLVVSFSSYTTIFWRAAPMVFIPLSMGVSYLSQERFRRPLIILFSIILILLSFSIVHKTFYDLQTFSFTQRDYQATRFIVDSSFTEPRARVLAHYRIMTYLRPSTLSDQEVIYRSDDSELMEGVTKVNYIIYSVGMSKSFLSEGIQPQESLDHITSNKYNLIHNSGSFSHIYYKP